MTGFNSIMTSCHLSIVGHQSDWLRENECESEWKLNSPNQRSIVLAQRALIEFSCRESDEFFMRDSNWVIRLLEKTGSNWIPVSAVKMFIFTACAVLCCCCLVEKWLFFGLLMEKSFGETYLERCLVIFILFLFCLWCNKWSSKVQIYTLDLLDSLAEIMYSYCHNSRELWKFLCAGFHIFYIIAFDLSTRSLLESFFMHIFFLLLHFSLSFLHAKEHNGLCMANRSPTKCTDSLHTICPTMSARARSAIVGSRARARSLNLLICIGKQF